MDETFESLCNKRNIARRQIRRGGRNFRASQGRRNKSALPVQAVSRTPHSTVIGALNPLVQFSTTFRKSRLAALMQDDLPELGPTCAQLSTQPKSFNRLQCRALSESSLGQTILRHHGRLPGVSSGHERLHRQPLKFTRPFRSQLNENPGMAAGCERCAGGEFSARAYRECCGDRR